MTVSYRYLADPSEPQQVLQWFRDLPSPPIESQMDGVTRLHFRNLGALARTSDFKQIDWKKSPVVHVYHPRVRRGVIWTTGTVNFDPVPLRNTFPELHKISLALKKWLSSYLCVFAHGPHEAKYTDFLRGTIKNYDSSVYAFPSGLAALQASRTFISEGDGEIFTDKLCNEFRLMGINICDDK